VGNLPRFEESGEHPILKGIGISKEGAIDT